jgi:hypothetical protein
MTDGTMSANETRVAYLNRILSGTVNSMVQYTAVSVPFVPAECESLTGRMDKMRDQEIAQVNVLSKLISRFRGVPSTEAFPYWNIDLNFLDIRFMARFGAEHQEKVIAEIEAGLDKIKSDPVAYTKVLGMLEEKRAHLDELRDMGKMPEPEPEAAPAEE